MTGGSLPAQARPVGIAGMVQAVPQCLPAVTGAPSGSIDRDAAGGGRVGRMGCQWATGGNTGDSSAAAALG